MNEKASKKLTTIETAFDIIEYVTETNGARVMEIADKFGIPDSTAHNYLGTLRQLGYLRKDGNLYKPTFQFLSIGGQVSVNLPAYRRLRATISELAEETRGTVQLVAEDQGMGIYVYHITAAGGVQSDVHIGKSVYLHTTSAGKAILAHLPEERIEQIIEHRGLPRVTENTITDKDKLLDHLQEIRDEGFGFNDEERIPGQQGVGVPILDANKQVIAAISVSGPKARVEEDLPSTILTKVNEVELTIMFE
jgi:DNA-binding IclR family transcriptional regulator